MTGLLVHQIDSLLKDMNLAQSLNTCQVDIAGFPKSYQCLTFNDKGNQRAKGIYAWGVASR